MTDSPTATATEAVTATGFTDTSAREERMDVAHELALAESHSRYLARELEASQRDVEALQTRQITDGADPRLTRFWELAGSIADQADFCDQYDRIAEEMNGPRRKRQYEVRTQIQVTVTRTETVEAIDSDDAASQIDLTTSEILEHIDLNGIEDWVISDTEVSEA